MTRTGWLAIIGCLIALGALLYWFKLKPILDTADKASDTFSKFIDWSNKGLAL